MKKITAWAKSHKIAAVFIGAGTFVFAVFAALLVSGLILMANGYEAEPVAEVTQEAAKKVDESRAEEPVEKPKETKAPEPKKAESPKVEKPKPSSKAETVKPKKADPVDPLTKRLVAAQKDLDVWFEECDWDNDFIDRGIAQYATGVCESKSIGVIVSGSDVQAEIFMEGVAEETPLGKYFIDDGMAVWSLDDGALNQAWDALGAPGFPKDMSDLVK